MEGEKMKRTELTGYIPLVDRIFFNPERWEVSLHYRVYVERHPILDWVRRGMNVLYVAIIVFAVLAVIKELIG